MNLGPTVAVVGIALLATASACGSSRPQVVRVSTFPWPEGPGPIVAARTPMTGEYVPLRELHDAIPSTLPQNPAQSCNVGAKVLLTLSNGRVLTYGPCQRPRSIEHLRLALISASRRHM